MSLQKYKITYRSTAGEIKAKHIMADDSGYDFIQKVNYDGGEFVSWDQVEKTERIIEAQSHNIIDLYAETPQH